jgi:hypothetical protein
LLIFKIIDNMGISLLDDVGSRQGMLKEWFIHRA